MTTLTPADAWQRMLAGNDRFTSGTQQHPHQDAARRADLVPAQAPFATLFGCADSRLAAEIIFDVGLGDLFVVRNAGQVIDSTILASLEYAVSALEVPLVVVLAHDHCGAIQATYEADATATMPDGFYIRDLVTRIHPAVVSAKRDADGSVEAVADIHLKNTVAAIAAQSELIATAIDEGRLGIIGVSYRLEDGHVHEAVHFGAALD